MLWLAIAHLRSWFHQMAGNTALPTLSVGPVSQEHTTGTGSPCSAETTCLPHRQNLPRLPAKPVPKVSRIVALPIPQGLLSASAKAPAQTHTDSLSGGHGKSKVVAPQTRQPARQALKAKQVVAQSTPQEVLSVPVKAAVQIPTDNLSGVSGKPKAVARQTLQRVAQVRKARSKPVKQATSGKKTSADKAAVLTHTAKPSGVRGTL
jgi:hypothetical protein